MYSSLHRLFNLKFNKLTNISLKPAIPHFYVELPLSHSLKSGIESFFNFSFFPYILLDLSSFSSVFEVSCLSVTYSLYLLPVFEFKSSLELFFGLLYLVSYPSNSFYVFWNLIYCITAHTKIVQKTLFCLQDKTHTP